MSRDEKMNFVSETFKCSNHFSHVSTVASLVLNAKVRVRTVV